MNKKKRRKRSKADIREAWRKNHFKEQREKEKREKEPRQSTSKQKHPTPLRPSELASLRPDKDIPWCFGCRAHTRYETVWEWTTKRIYGSTETKRVQRPRNRCRRCNAYVTTPAQSRAAENMLWFVLPLMLLFFGPLFILSVALHAGWERLLAYLGQFGETVLLVWLLILLLTALVLGRFAWFGQLSLSYRRWSKWAKEHNDNETN